MIAKVMREELKSEGIGKKENESKKLASKRLYDSDHMLICKRTQFWSKLFRICKKLGQLKSNWIKWMQKRKKENAKCTDYIKEAVEDKRGT